MQDHDLWLALLAKRGGKVEPLHETVATLSYESGRMLEQAMYLHRLGPDPARIGFVKSDLIDVIAQCVLICESLGVPFWQMKELGVEKAMERLEGKEQKT